jgi:hypothetical protein
MRVNRILSAITAGTAVNLAVAFGMVAARDLTKIWVDVATTNAPVIVSVDLKV